VVKSISTRMLSGTGGHSSPARPDTSSRAAALMRSAATDGCEEVAA
jgi:hypothetical protein